MIKLRERIERNPVTGETKEEEWAFFENSEAKLRNEKHLELAYEWLRKRGKTVPLKVLLRENKHNV